MLLAPRFYVGLHRTSIQLWTFHRPCDVHQWPSRSLTLHVVWNRIFVHLHTRLQAELLVFFWLRYQICWQYKELITDESFCYRFSIRRWRCEYAMLRSGMHMLKFVSVCYSLFVCWWMLRGNRHSKSFIALELRQSFRNVSWQRCFEKQLAMASACGLCCPK